MNRPGENSRFRWVFAVAAIAGLLDPSSARSQSSLEVGDRVRVRAIGERGWIVGRVEANAADSLGLSLDHASTRRSGCTSRLPTCARALGTATLAPFWLRRSELEAVERSVGTRRNARRLGLTLGLVGGVGGALLYSTCMGCYTEWALAGATTVGGLGFLLGATVGYFIVSEEWQTIARFDVAFQGTSTSAIVVRLTPSPRRRGGVELAWSIR